MDENINLKVATLDDKIIENSTGFKVDDTTKETSKLLIEPSKLNEKNPENKHYK